MPHMAMTQWFSAISKRHNSVYMTHFSDIFDVSHSPVVFLQRPSSLFDHGPLVVDSKLKLLQRSHHMLI